LFSVRFITTAIKYIVTAKRNIQTAIRFIQSAKRNIATAKRIIATAIRNLLTTLKLKFSGEKKCSHQQPFCAIAGFGLISET